MCKNEKVFNIDSEKVYNFNLLPGFMMKNPCKFTYDLWMSIRRSDNSLANRLRVKIADNSFLSDLELDRLTYALSLSDCYWIKDEKDNVLFEEISPYFVDFYKGVGIYNRLSAPSIYLQGYLSKEWINSEWLNKYGDIHIETECFKLCKMLDIPCAEIKDIENGVSVKNITDTKLMLEQADMSGRVDTDDFTERDILSLFGLQGLQMLVIDAIVGNGDRHAGNFGWLRDTNTGEYVCMAPLYDFDHALDSKREIDVMLSELVKIIKDNKKYCEETLRICNTVITINTEEIFIIRAKNLIKLLKEEVK